MATTLNVNVLRAGSPPLAIALVPDHLPADVRAALEHLRQTRADLDCAERDFAAATPDNWHDLNDDLTTAREAADKALEDFATVNASSSTAIRDTATAAFTAAMERANGAVHAALDALTDAQQAAALAVSVKPGKPIVSLDTKSATAHPTRFPLASARGTLREVLSTLPDGLD